MLSFSGLGLLVKNSASNAPFVEITPLSSPSTSPSITPSPTPSATEPQSQKTSKKEKNNLSRSKIPVLMYHHIQDVHTENWIEKDLSVSISNFDLQMAFLKKEGFQTIKLLHLVQNDFSNSKPIVITFDDGYKDVYENAYPIMKKYGFRGTLFVIDKLIGAPGYVNLAMLKQLAKEGWEIGGHSRTHRNLTNLEPEELSKEIFLTNYINSPVFAYPAGKHNETVRNYLKDAGFVAAVTTESGFYQPGDDPLAIKRIRIKGGDSIERFAKKVLATKDPSR